MKQYLSVSMMVLCLLVLSACGGGGGEPQTTPTSPNQTFDLSKVYSTTLGTVYSTQLTGSDTDGFSYSGTYAVANRAQTMLGGVLVTPRDIILSLTSGGISQTVTATSYFDTSGYLISIGLQSEGRVCTPVSPDSAPTIVKIGDFGISSTIVCDDNTSTEENWRVEDGGNGSIRYISSSTEKDQFGSVLYITDITYVINSNGDILSFKTVSTEWASNYTLTYQSI